MYEDRDGILTIPKHHDSTEIYTLDWSDLLDPSETISSSSFTADGVTVSGAALTTPKTTITVADSGGSLTNTVVTSLGKTLVQNLRFADTEPTGSDY